MEPLRGMQKAQATFDFVNALSTLRERRGFLISSTSRQRRPVRFTPVE
jgi:hypothetical protein